MAMDTTTNTKSKELPVGLISDHASSSVSFNSDWKTLLETIDRIESSSGDFRVPSRVEFGPSIFSRQLKHPTVVPEEAHIQQKTFAKLLNLLSPELEGLKISVDRNCVIDFRKVFYQALTGFPKLKALRLSFQNILEAGHKGYCYIYSIGELMEKILSLSPVLDTVVIYWATWTEHVDYYEDHYLEKLPASVRSFTLRKNLMRPITPQILSSLRLPSLTTLSIDFSHSYLTGQDAFKVFNAFRSHLISLTVTNYGMDEICFPEFERLTTLDLGVGLNVVLKPRVEFSVVFPRVADLRLEDMKSLDLLKYLFPMGFRAAEVRSLILPRIVQSREVMFGLISGFNGLKKLVDSSVSSLDTLEPIFRCLSELTELKLNFQFSNSCGGVGFKSGDSVLTGIPDSICSQFEQTRPLENQNEATKLQPGIADLKELRLLHITSSLDSNSQLRLTNATAYFGFMKLDDLVELKVEKFNFTDECISDLEARFGNISPNDSTLLK